MRRTAAVLVVLSAFLGACTLFPGGMEEIDEESDVRPFENGLQNVHNGGVTNYYFYTSEGIVVQVDEGALLEFQRVLLEADSLGRKGRAEK